LWCTWVLLEDRLCDFFLSFFFFLTFPSFRRFLSYSSYPLNLGWQHPFSRLGKNPVVARLSPRGGVMALGETCWNNQGGYH
jgi:hypothetical protein